MVDGVLPDASPREVWDEQLAADEAAVGLRVVVEFNKGRWYRGRVTAAPEAAPAGRLLAASDSATPREGPRAALRQPCPPCPPPECTSAAAGPRGRGGGNLQIQRARARWLPL